MATAAARFGHLNCLQTPLPSAALKSRVGKPIFAVSPYARYGRMGRSPNLQPNAVHPRKGKQAKALKSQVAITCRGFLPNPHERNKVLGSRKIVKGAPRLAVPKRGRGQMENVETRNAGEPHQSAFSSSGKEDEAPQKWLGEMEMRDAEAEPLILPHYAEGLMKPQNAETEANNNITESDNIWNEDVLRGRWDKIEAMEAKAATRHPIHQALLQYSRWMAKKVVRYGVVFSSTAAVSCTAAQLIGTGDFSSPIVSGWLGGFVIGSFLSSAAIWRFKLNSTQRNVVITGSTRGLGKALAREFLRFGDNVVVASRSEEAVRRTVAELRKEMLEDGLGQPAKRDYSWRNRKREAKPHRVVGRACDVSDSTDVRQLAAFAQKSFGHVDLWINNAGQNPGAKSLMEFADEEISSVVATNLMGSLICTKEAIRTMQSQKTGGHVFNMDGNGSGGNATPQYAVYGATKCALRQLQQTLLKETASSKVGVHTASPGMVLTELLLAGATLSNKQAFNFICEQPETVAKALVPRLRRVRGTGAAINYLTPPRVLLALALAWFRRGRWFDAEGRAVYAAEAERLRAWGEPKRPSPEAAAMELVPTSAWLCLNCSSLICLYLVLQNMASST